MVENTERKIDRNCGCSSGCSSDLFPLSILTVNTGKPHEIRIFPISFRKYRAQKGLPPKPRAEGSSPSAPAKNASTAFAVGAFFVCDNCNLNPKARAACRATPPKRRTAACGRIKCGAEAEKQGALRSAPSEQGDYVSEGRHMAQILSSPSLPCVTVFCFFI